MSDKVYDRAWKLLIDESKWNHGTLAIDLEGSHCRATDPRAVRWCARGAIMRVYPPSERMKIYRKLAGKLENKCVRARLWYSDPKEKIEEWNDCDETAHGEVV